MKLKLLAALFSLVAMGVGSAATSVTISNVNLNSPARGQLITNSAGNPLASSGLSWAVGNFDAGVNFGGAASELISAFNINGSSAAFAGSAGVFGALGGPGVTDAATPTSGTAGGFVGTPIYAVIANNANFALATEFIVINTGVNWTNEIEGVGGSVSAFTYNGQVLRGGVTTITGAPAGPTSQFNGQSGLTFVPEPSAALLGLLGAVGLIRRRR